MTLGVILPEPAQTVQPTLATQPIMQTSGAQFNQLLNNANHVSHGGSIRTNTITSGNAELDAIFEEAGRRYNLSPDLLKAVAKVESNFRPDAVSRVGAMGIMQLMPGTAKHLGVDDPFDVRQNIFGGARYLREQLDRFDGDITLALAAYNAGWPTVQRHGGVPPIRETQNYVQKVLSHLADSSVDPSQLAISFDGTRGNAAVGGPTFGNGTVVGANNFGPPIGAVGPGSSPSTASPSGPPPGKIFHFDEAWIQMLLQRLLAEKAAAGNNNNGSEGQNPGNNTGDNTIGGGDNGVGDKPNGPGSDYTPEYPVETPTEPPAEPPADYQPSEPPTEPPEYSPEEAPASPPSDYYAEEEGNN
ncbi:MAG: lytic transglycosylase domain-containing protein [Oscillospiraceae bacterium]|nr:lytic transglycosylase domain-containing protein [Oscillospiraceae bacterium]